MRKLLSLLLVLMLMMTGLTPLTLAGEEKPIPLSRAEAARMLDDHFMLVDVQSLNIPTFETTPRGLGYTAHNGAIIAANVIPAAKDGVQKTELAAIETVLNAGLMALEDDGMSFRPDKTVTAQEFYTALAKGYLGVDVQIDHASRAAMMGLFAANALTEDIMDVKTAAAILEELRADTKVIAVFATSDIHGNYIPYKSSYGQFQIGSVARIASILKEARAMLGEENVLYVDGGDSPYNTTLANVTNGDVSVAALNALGLTATVLGNHDFDYSFKNLLRLADSADYAMLSANTRYKDDKMPADAAGVYPAQLGDALVVEAQGLKVGIFGVTDMGSAATTLYMNTEDIQFDDDLMTAHRLVKELKEEENCDVIIALSHLHGKNAALVEQNPEVLVSIGGGNDIAGRPTIIGDGQYLINPGKHGEAVTQINLITYKGAVTGIVHNQLFLTEAYPEDPDVKSLVDTYNAQVDKELDKTIGFLNVNLEWSAQLVRTQNSPIANLVADALFDYFRADGAHLAIVNGGGIRAPLEAGEVSLREVTSVLPFDNNMMLVETGGQTIWDALQNGISAWPESNGKFAQVAGMTYAFEKDGEKNALTAVTLKDGTPLDLGARYKVVINSFLAGGGDGYTMFNVLDESKESAADVTQLVYVNKTYMRDALEKYFRTNSSQDAPLKIDLSENRITLPKQ